MKVPVDITFHPSWWNRHAGVCFNRAFFFDENYRLQADVEMRKTLYEKFGDLGIGEKEPKPRPILGSDLIASGFLHSEILGCEVRYSDSNPPEVICRNMTEEEVENLYVPDLSKSRLWGEIERQMQNLHASFGFVEPCINLMGIQNIALDVRGSELFIDYYENPTLAHHLLEVCTTLSVEIGKRFRTYSKSLSAGVTSIVKKTVPQLYLTSNCSVDMVSLETYRAFLLPYDKKLSEAFEAFGIHHCGKSMEHVVEGYAQIPLQFAEVGAFSDMKAVRDTLPEVYLNARYSPVRLKEATFEEMKRDIQAILQDGKPLRLLSVSCVGIDGDTPTSKVREFLTAVQEAKAEVTA